MKGGCAARETSLRLFSLCALCVKQRSGAPARRPRFRGRHTYFIPADAVRRMVAALHEGPPRARVDRIDERAAKAEGLRRFERR